MDKIDGKSKDDKLPEPPKLVKGALNEIPANRSIEEAEQTTTKYTLEYMGLVAKIMEGENERKSKKDTVDPNILSGALVVHTRANEYLQKGLRHFLNNLLTITNLHTDQNKEIKMNTEARIMKDDIISVKISLKTSSGNLCAEFKHFIEQILSSAIADKILESTFLVGEGIHVHILRIDRDTFVELCDPNYPLNTSGGNSTRDNVLKVVSF